VSEPPSQAIVIIPARNEHRRIAATVTAARSLPDVAVVIVVDDGSSDDTAQLAETAGATVVAHRRNRGKAAAMTTGARAAWDAGWRVEPLLFLDADLEASAAQVGPLIRAVTSDEADLAIATLPRTTAGGGRGFVVRLSAKGIEKATGWRPEQPLSGQRCIRRGLFAQIQPLARGFGVETGMTIDALRLGARVAEYPVEVHHRVTGTSFRDQRHRLRQYRDAWWALARRRAL
jgi:hypothetical protein